MLVLRRFCGQSIVIGKNAEIEIKVLRSENGTISLGINAPKDVLVDRLEIHEKRLQESLSKEASVSIRREISSNTLREFI